MRKSRCLLIFTRDLRINDNPALDLAISQYSEVIPVFILDQSLINKAHDSGNRVSYLFECLQDLNTSLVELGSGLAIEQGSWINTAVELSKKYEVDAVIWARDTSQWSQVRDSELSKGLKRSKIEHHLINSHSVVPPDALSPSTGELGRGYKIFTPYYRRWIELPLRTIGSSPKKISSPSEIIFSERLFLPKPEDLATYGYSPNREFGGETLSRKALNKWITDHLHEYENIHNDLESDSTSHLSSALHFGTLSATEIVTKLRSKKGSEAFIRQLCWRDFYQHILFHRPDAAWNDYADRNDSWNDNNEHFKAWCDGQTGYPLVDAAMRQLQEEGFMHNRARMVVASFLTKDLYMDWKLGARWFLKWLTDGDIASNNLNWQWTAGTGTDTNPHRIFNPIRQSERFDPKGEYIKRYVPELSEVPIKNLHFPHDLRGHLDTAHLVQDYPLPIVDHSRAIAQYKDIQAQNKLKK